MKNPYYPYTVDNRSKLKIDYPKADYKYNYDKYKRKKQNFFLFSIIGIIFCIIIIYYIKSDIMQTVFASILGGLISLLIWLMTVDYQDKVSLELSIIDEALLCVDKHLEYLRGTINLINPCEYTVIQLDNDDLRFRLYHFLQEICNIDSDKELIENLVLKWFDGSDCTLLEYKNKWFNMANSETKTIPYQTQNIKKTLDWNEYIVKTELLKLKKHLLNYKKYILCGDVPVRKCDLKQYQTKANRFDRIFNKKKK